MGKYTLEKLKNSKELRSQLYREMLVDWMKPIDKSNKNYTDVNFSMYLRKVFDLDFTSYFISIYDEKFGFKEILPELALHRPPFDEFYGSKRGDLQKDVYIVKKRLKIQLNYVINEVKTDTKIATQ